MAKTKGQTFPYRFGNETKKRVGIVPEFVLLRTDYFHLVQNLLSSTKQKCALSMEQIGAQTQTFWFHSS
jgi:hypothetical protein